MNICEDWVDRRCQVLPWQTDPTTMLWTSLCTLGYAATEKGLFPKLLPQIGSMKLFKMQWRAVRVFKGLSVYAKKPSAARACLKRRWTVFIHFQQSIIFISSMDLRYSLSRCILGMLFFFVQPDLRSCEVPRECNVNIHTVEINCFFFGPVRLYIHHSLSP